MLESTGECNQDESGYDQSDSSDETFEALAFLMDVNQRCCDASRERRSRDGSDLDVVG